MDHASTAEQLRSLGRGDDSMLVHMTPGEVSGLQQLALASGGSLTINPHTGLPEAGWLGKLLPTIIGMVAAPLTGGLVNPLTVSALVGAGTGIATGDIGKGLMAGLQAYGGAALGAGLGLNAGSFGIGQAANAAKTAATAGNLVSGGAANMLPTGAPVTSAAFTPTSLGVTPLDVSLNVAKGSSMLANPAVAPELANLGGMASTAAAPAASAFAPTMAAQTVQAAAPAAAKTGLAGFGQRFAETARQGLPGGMISKVAPYAAGLSVLDAVNQASMPTMRMPEEEKSTYEGPYRAQPRRLMPRESGPGGEIVFFDQVNPYPGYLTATGALPRGFADGGEVASRPMSHAELTSTGYTDPTTGVRSQLQAGDLTPGMSSTLGGVRYIVNDLGRWVPYTESAAAPATASPPVQSTVPAYRAPSSLPAGGLGALPAGQASQMLPGLISMFQTSPGPITASRTYPGGSPSERIRRNIAGGVDAGRREADFGFAKSSNISAPAANPMSINNNAMGIYDSMAVPGRGPMYSGFAPYYGDMLTEADTTRDSQNRTLPFAKGGEVSMKDGSFVVDARTVSELGNGSSNAGIDRLSRMGGVPVRGDGDGVSDSVPARIGGTQEARVARDEVIFSPEAVARIGGGSHAKGTQKLYGLMDKAHKARKKAGRGQDTKVAKGLGALA